MLSAARGRKLKSCNSSNQIFIAHVTRSLVVRHPGIGLVYPWYNEGPQTFLFPFCRPQFVVSPGGGAVATQSVLSLCDSGQAEEKKRKSKTDLPQEMLSQMPLQHFPSHFIVQNGATCTPPKGLWWPRWTRLRPVGCEGSKPYWPATFLRLLAF